MNMVAKMIALDWRSIKVYRMRLILLPIFVFIFGWSSGSIIVIPLCVIFCSNFSTNFFAVEDKGSLNNFYLTLPVKRKNIVVGRYILSIILLLCGIIIGIGMIFIINQISRSKWYLGINGHIVVIALSYLLYAMLHIFMYPILFKLGYAKGRFWGLVLPIAVNAIFLGVYLTVASTSTMIKLISFASEHLLLVSGGMAILATVLMIISYFVSVKLYSKRDF